MNFKKQISFFLALFILIVNSSASLVLHFCNDQIAYVALVYNEDKLVNTSSEDSCCVTDEVIEDKSCCSDEEIKIDKKIDYSFFKDFHFDVLAVSYTSEISSYFSEIDILSSKNKIVEYYCDSNAPPFYKLYSQLIFYA